MQTSPSPCSALMGLHLSGRGIICDSNKELDGGPVTVVMAGQHCLLHSYLLRIVGSLSPATLNSVTDTRMKKNEWQQQEVNGLKF